LLPAAVMKQKATKQATQKQPSRALGTIGKMVDRALDVAIDALTPGNAPATKLLAAQHALVKQQFEKLESARTYAAKRDLFEELARNLVAHDAIERELFYPACEKAMGMTDLLGEALVEHGVIEFCVYQADQAKERDFAFKCQVLSEMVLHHVKEEEREFFPRAERALGPKRLDALGAQMRERFEQAKGQDFRQAVYDNLKQVLAGAMKPTKRAVSKKNGAATSASRRHEGPSRARGRRTARASARA
jgi:hypothetical protein